MRAKMYKIVFVIFVIFLISFCADLDRDNMLDPKNADAALPLKIIAEAFVNDSTGFPYSNVALTALEKVHQMNSFAQDLLILEYHVESDEWNDLFETGGCLDRYHKYVPDPAQRGIPDVFFNGRENRVQGATNEKVIDRYLSEVSSLSDEQSRFRIIGEKVIANNELQLDVQFAKLGKQGEDNLILQVVIAEDVGLEGHRAVVRKILQPAIISKIDGGEVKSFSFTETLSNVSDPGQVFAIVFIQKSDASLKVFQAEKF